MTKENFSASMPTNSIVAMMEVSWGGKLNMATIFHAAFKSNPPPYMTMPLTRKQTKFRGKSSSISFTIGKFVVFVLPSFAVNLKQFPYLCDILWQVCLRCREDICDLWGLNSHWTLIDSNSFGSWLVSFVAIVLDLPRKEEEENHEKLFRAPLAGSIIQCDCRIRKLSG